MACQVIVWRKLSLRWYPKHMSPAPKILGIVGMRAGSKSIRDKNIKPLLGKPLFAWIAEEAKKSKYLTRIIASTDSLEYAELARQYGLEVPFREPNRDGTDPDQVYLAYAATWLKENEGWQADIIVRLPPTSPLCTVEHIDKCIELLLEDADADSSRTVTDAPKHPYKLWKPEGQYLVPFVSEAETGLTDAHSMPRQSFPKVYRHVDVIAVRWKTLVQEKSMAGKKVRFHEIPNTESIDIDSEIDFLVAETLLNKAKKENTP